jgi:riboflavin kinase/FMN adenylyltransferase
MRILQGLDGLRSVTPGGVLSVGNFDGMHLGHRSILKLCSELAGGKKGEGGSEGGSAVIAVTFEPHPLTVLRPEAVPPRLTPRELKQRLLAAAGVDELVVLPPDRAVLNLTAEQFWEILRDEVRPAHMVEGRDFNFGKNRRGTIDRLQEWSAGSGITLHVAPAVTAALLDLSVVPVSSTLIRWLLANGRVRDAAICLGRPLLLCGTVVRGAGRGHTLDCPTANLDGGDQLIPGDGIYAGACTVEGYRYAAAVSIGVARMFGETERHVEAHLIGYSGDLYGRLLELELIDWLRSMERFASGDELRGQLARDIREARDAAGRLDDGADATAYPRKAARAVAVLESRK